MNIEEIKDKCNKFIDIGIFYIFIDYDLNLNGLNNEIKLHDYQLEGCKWMYLLWLKVFY